MLSVEVGCVDYGSGHGPDFPVPPGLDAAAGPSPNAGKWRWWPDYFRSATAWGAAVPLWPLFLLSILCSAWLWRLDRKPKPGHCPRCGYDLAGIPSGACPECGSASTPTPG
jgi:hypothetical protein